MRRIVYYLLIGSRGGPTRVKILRSLKERPKNMHQLCQELALDYKTIQHHVFLLSKHRLLDREGAYGGIFFVSDFMESVWDEFSSLWK